MCINVCTREGEKEREILKCKERINPIPPVP